ncbi:MAG: hypothetical protein IJL58_05225 [Bacteroidales bacterium]|nr:hypothetical protein [Bacteroidales bacterium]
MKRILHIILAAVMAAFCVLPASGQSYKKNKVRTDPEPLEFRKVYWISSKNHDKVRKHLMKWDCNKLDLSLTGFPVNSDGKCFHLNVDGVDFEGVKGSITGTVNVIITEGPTVLELKDIHTYWRNHFYVDLSKEDNSFNRTWLWRVNHNPTIVEAARERCKELFEILCQSMDEYLKDGPPMELEAL